MEDYTESDYDVVVVGTGLQESIVAAACARIGKKVLHVDWNAHYGDVWASLSLSELQEWEPHPPADLEGKPGAVPDGATFLPCSRPVRVQNLKRRIHAPQHAPIPEPVPEPAVPEPEPVAKPEPEPEHEPTVPAPVAETAVGEPAPSSAPELAAGSPEEGEPAPAPAPAPRVETWDDVLKRARNYSMDLVPKVLYASGDLVALLISANLGRYLEFKAVTDTYFLTAQGAKKIPCSSEVLMRSRDISPRQKRFLVKFLKLCRDFDAAGEAGAGNLEQTLGAYVADFPPNQATKLAADLQDVVVHGMAGCSPDVPAREGLQRIQLFVKSIGRFGITPFIAPMYGGGEVCQAMCRVCAVYGGVYVLREAFRGACCDESGTCTGAVVGDKFIRARNVLGPYGPSLGSPRLSRCVVITDAPLAAEESMVLLTIPPNTFGNPSAVQIFALGPAMSCTPTGKYVVHLMCQRAAGAESDLQPTFDALFRTAETPEDAPSLAGLSRPTALWSAFFDVDCNTAGSAAAGAGVYEPLPEAQELGYSSPIANARTIFAQMYPEEEFLPATPNPEDIVWESGPAVPELPEAPMTTAFGTQYYRMGAYRADGAGAGAWVLRDNVLAMDSAGQEQGEGQEASGGKARGQGEAQRITEKSNELTTNLDSVGPEGIFRLLRQVDAQLFCGWHNHACINDREIRTVMEGLSAQIAGKLRECMAGTGRHCFVFSGCGTSGRIAWLCARAFNRALAESHPDVAPCFKYTLAGGDESLVISNELPEDDPAQGAKDLQAAVEGFDSCVFFGITCGMSAPYVAGQIEYALEASTISPVLVGFNPLALARDVPIEGWTKTCFEVFSSMGARGGVVLNPIVGPEALTASSRMKGGSVTKLLLDTICLSAIDRARSAEGPLAAFGPPHDAFLSAMEAAYRGAYSDIEGLGRVTTVASDCVRQPGGHMYYLGSNSTGLLGLLDCSEMVDTYGCREDEIRAFIKGGWGVCANPEGDLTARGPAFHLSMADFEREHLGSLGAADCVIGLASTDDELAGLLTVLRSVAATPAQACAVCIGSEPSEWDSLRLAQDICAATAGVALPATAEGEAGRACVDFATKLVLNGISTSVNVIKGAVYGNSMINLTVSNNKLCTRSAQIVASIAGCSFEHAHECLLQSIHDGQLTDEQRSLPLSEHIKLATPKRFIVPIAALVATGRFSVEKAQTALAQPGVSLRQLLRSAVSQTEC